MKCSILTILILAVSATSYAQEGAIFQGKVKNVLWERTYLSRIGVSVKSEKEKLWYDEYDKSGLITRTSSYGNGEERIFFDRSSSQLKQTVFYFDVDGNLLKNSEKFIAKTTDPPQTGLCSEFTSSVTRDEKNQSILRIETCTDGTQRATIITKCFPENKTTRVYRIDRNNRSWDFTQINDSTGKIIEIKRVIDDGKHPKFSANSKWVYLDTDKKQNWVKVIISDLDPNRNNLLTSQYVFERTISYYEE